MFYPVGNKSTGWWITINNIIAIFKCTVRVPRTRRLMDTSRRSKEKHPSTQMPNTPGNGGRGCGDGGEQWKGQKNNKQCETCMSFTSYDRLKIVKIMFISLSFLLYANLMIFIHLFTLVIRFWINLPIRNRLTHAKV